MKINAKISLLRKLSMKFAVIMTKMQFKAQYGSSYYQVLAQASK